MLKCSIFLGVKFMELNGSEDFWLLRYFLWTLQKQFRSSTIVSWGLMFEPLNWRDMQSRLPLCVPLSGNTQPSGIGGKPILGLLLMPTITFQAAHYCKPVHESKLKCRSWIICWLLILQQSMYSSSLYHCKNCLFTSFSTVIDQK